MSLEKQLQTMREAGYMVAVHNDYRLGGTLYTFWLFTHSDGTWVKGEGETDTAALKNCLDQL